MTLHYLDNYTDNYFRYFYMRVLLPGVLSYLFLWYSFIFMISFHICGIFSYLWYFFIFVVFFHIFIPYHINFTSCIFFPFYLLLIICFSSLISFNLSNPKAFISSLTKVRWIKFSASLLVHNRITALFFIQCSYTNEFVRFPVILINS